ncbi:MAG: hypothetical protein NT053_09705 [Cyanobacteria bacterium]|nr:hypothetical protein [Cyanobacteriota bacterium]
MKTLRHRSAGLLATSLLLAGVSALAPTSVRAATTCTFGMYSSLAKPACVKNFIFDKQDDKTLKLTKLPTIGSGTLQFTEQTPGIYVLDADFIPDLSAPSGMGEFEYDLTIDGPPNLFTFFEGGLAIIGPPVGSPKFKVKQTTTGLPMLMADEMDADVTALFDSDLKAITVKNEYLVTTGSINSFQNSFTQVPGGTTDEVPGPLPLLGAGAAFGFSRRLRTRVLAARGA